MINWLTVLTTRLVQNGGGFLCEAVAEADFVVVAPETVSATQLIDSWLGEKIFLNVDWVYESIKKGRALLEEDNWGGFLAANSNVPVTRTSVCSTIYLVVCTDAAEDTCRLLARHPQSSRLWQKNQPCRTSHTPFPIQPSYNPVLQHPSAPSISHSQFHNSQCLASLYQCYKPVLMVK